MFTIVGYVVRSPIFFFLIGDLMEIGLRSAAFLPLISLKKGLKFASHVNLLKTTLSKFINLITISILTAKLNGCAGELNETSDNSNIRLSNFLAEKVFFRSRIQCLIYFHL